MQPEAVLELAKSHCVRQIDLRFSDLSALEHHVSYPVTAMSADSLREGFGIDGSTMRGWDNTAEHDLLLLPDGDSAFLDPFFEVPTLVMHCDLINPITRRSSERDPRSVARNAELYLENTGLADAARFGIQTEFFVFDEVQFDQNARASFYYVNRRQDPAPGDEFQALRTNMVETLTRCGLNISCHRRGIRQKGQCDIEQSSNTLLRAADHMMICKYVVRHIAQRNGKTATFMPKPLYGGRGSGMHTHQSLWKGGCPLFAGDAYAGLSRMALHYIGGLLKHARALSAIVAPSTNSYQRLARGWEAPVHLAYSRSNKSAACHVPAHSTRLQARRVEFRPPDPSANPYLAFSAMLMAGLDGVINRIHPGDAVDSDMDEVSAARIPHLPASLEAALDCLEDDHEFLLKDEVFSGDLIEAFIEYKRKHESEAVRIRPHPHEFALYYDV